MAKREKNETKSSAETRNKWVTTRFGPTQYVILCPMAHWLWAFYDNLPWPVLVSYKNTKTFLIKSCVRTETVESGQILFVGEEGR